MRHVASKLGRELSVTNITEIMTGSKKNWRVCGDLMRKIMQRKERDERSLERAIDAME
jgi:hypothetical protein